jgi:hypothetical protein
MALNLPAKEKFANVKVEDEMFQKNLKILKRVEEQNVRCEIIF